MAKKNVKIETTSTDKVKKYWVAIDDTDVASHTESKGSIKLEEGTHIVSYWAIGTPGGKITITGTVGSDKKFEISPRTQRDGRVANSRRFTI